MANTSTQSTSSMQAAKTKLDAALDRLENAIDSRATATSAAGSGNGKLDEELKAAQQEISALKEKNQIVSTRLDGAIGRMKEILES